MSSFRLLPVAALFLPAAAIAQQAAPVPAPTPTASAIPVPSTPVGLPTATPTPTPTPAVSPAPVVTPSAVPVQPTPTVRVTTRPKPTSAATPAPAPQITPTPTPTPTPTASQSSVPIAETPPPAVSETPAVPPAGASSIPLWAIAAGLAVLLAAAGLVLRQRRTAVRQDEDAVAAPAAAIPVPERSPRPNGPLAVSQDATPPSSDAIEAVLTIDVRPLRAGVNLLSATVESEVALTNPGARAATDVRVEIGMIGAHAGQVADLAAIAASPVGRPLVAPFIVPPGDTVRLSAVAALPRAAIVPLNAGGRPIFVPIVTVKVEAMIGDKPVRQTAAFAVGIERVDSARLAPFRLDEPPRTFDTVAARPHPIG